jgi:hypothetical protein
MLNRLLDDAKRADLALPSAPDQQFLYYHFKSDHQPYLMMNLAAPLPLAAALVAVAPVAVTAAMGRESIPVCQECEALWSLMSMTAAMVSAHPAAPAAVL